MSYDFNIATDLTGCADAEQRGRKEKEQKRN
jgi:hypothetical protein